MRRASRTIGAAALSVVLLPAFGCTPEPSRPQVELGAKLVTPTDITLRWKGGGSGVGGWAVEFATEPRGRYTTLGFLPVSRRRYDHPDLMPRTTFYYRVRPYEQEPVKGATAKAYGDRIRFGWTDTTRDEDGFLVETRDGRPVAFARPDHESFILHTMPGEGPSDFRIRAFHYGDLSNLVHARTGDPRRPT